MSLSDIQFVDQRALTLIFDIVILLEQSEIAGETQIGFANARSSIANAALLLECIANSCLLALRLPAKLLQELDKLPPISKLDYHLFAVCGQHIDRGSRETELATDVLKLRDHIVHPKPKPGMLAGKTEQEYVDYGATKTLDIPLDNRVWGKQVGVKVSKAVTGFLKKYFLESCSFSKGQITTLLVVRERELLYRMTPSWVSVNETEHELLKKWLPEFHDILDLRVFKKDA